MSFRGNAEKLLSDLNATKVNDDDEIKFALEHRF